MDYLKTAHSPSCSSTAVQSPGVWTSPRDTVGDGREEKNDIKHDGVGFQLALRTLADAVIADAKRHRPYPHRAPNTMDLGALQSENKRLRKELVEARRALGEPYSAFLASEPPLVDVHSKEPKSSANSKQRLMQSLVSDLQRVEKENVALKSEYESLKVAYKRARRVIVKQRGDSSAAEKRDHSCDLDRGSGDKNPWVEVLGVLEDIVPPNLASDRTIRSSDAADAPHPRFIPVAEDGDVRAACVQKLQTICAMIRESKSASSLDCSAAESDKL